MGFYSSFIVADQVEVITRKAGEAVATRWASAGEDEFTVSEETRESSGTTVILYLKSDAEEFADSWRVRSVIKKYSDHISVPVMMPEEQSGPRLRTTRAQSRHRPSGRLLMRRKRFGPAVVRTSPTTSIRHFTSTSLTTLKIP